MGFIRNALFSAVLMTMLFPAGSAGAADSYTVDPVHSFVYFKVLRGGVTNVVGRFNEVAGTAVWDEANPAAGSLQLTIQAGSVDSGNERRDAHLMSQDFFSVKEFPVLEFKSTDIQKAGADAWDVTGDFTLHGVTNPVTLKMTKVGAGGDRRGRLTIGFEAEFTINRSEFGMTQAGRIAGEEVHCTVNILAIGQ